MMEMVSLAQQVIQQRLAICPIHEQDRELRCAESLVSSLQQGQSRLSRSMLSPFIGPMVTQ